jgi:hypothetical protein
MSLAQVEVEAAENALSISHPEEEQEYRLEQGDFVAIVQPHASRYSFSVRDLRRERPTIHGFGVDFPHALIAVTQLLNALTTEH